MENTICMNNYEVNIQFDPYLNMQHIILIHTKPTPIIILF